MKLVSRNFFPLTIFLSGLNRKVHFDLTGDIAVRKQNLTKKFFDSFLLLWLLMTVASLPGPDKREIKPPVESI